MANLKATTSEDIPEQFPDERYNDHEDGSDFGDDEDEAAAAAADAFEEKLNIAKTEDTGVKALRVVTALVLIGVAVSVCLVMYFQARETQKEDFSQGFQQHGSKLISGLDFALRSRLGIVRGFAMDLSFNANGSFPFYTPPGFYHRAQHVSQMARLPQLAIMPKVATDQKDDWHAYVQQNSGWLAQDLAFQEGIPVENVTGIVIAPVMIKMVNRTPTVETGPGPYFPTWVNYPPAANPSVINIQIYGSVLGRQFIDAAMNATTIALTRSIDYLDVANPSTPAYHRFKVTNPDYQGEPFVQWYQPIYDSYPETDQSQIVAMVATGVVWHHLFEDILQDGTPEIVLILENRCGQTYTIKVNGPKATVQGHGDDHDSNYDDLVMAVTTDSLLDQREDGVDNEEEYGKMNPSVSIGDCPYRVRIYPTQELENSYYDSTPVIYTLALAAMFLITCMVFLAFDSIVEQRQKKVLKSALQSGKLVSSLFPKDVRNQLYKEEEAKTKAKENEKGWLTTTSTTAATDGLTDKQAIANLYPATTIFFCDLAGFTKWSSTRTPAEVFELLEALYGQFDVIAARYKVFKVETIGDCYVAVTGLPEPQPDHALIMTKFSRSCMAKLPGVLASSAEKLGEDTLELQMRVGLHSGPVTGGVLRGQKARFQLFGDSVNTASRMESNGMPGRIHVSEATAIELRKHGKEEWLTLREDKITAKGKGLMTTYWVNPKASGTRTGSVTSAQSSHAIHIDPEMAAVSVLGPQQGQVDAEGDTNPFFVEV